MMTRVRIHPDYLSFLRQHGLDRPEAILRLPQTIVSGHPDRQVSRVVLGQGEASISAFLKREHRVPWKERWGNWLAGFGWSSKSWREMLTLSALEKQFSAIPHWLAAAELADGRAFLLVREIPQTVELRQAVDLERERLHALGLALASLHATGWVHGDLYANHLLIQCHSKKIFFIDWQRARRSTSRSWADLAALAATLPESLSPRARLQVLRSYLGSEKRSQFRLAARRIHGLEQRLRQRRHVQSKAIAPILSSKQRLLCLQPENQLCVTAAYQDLWETTVPDFLCSSLTDRCEPLLLSDGSRGWLTVRRYRLPWWRRPERWTSPQRLQMSLLFRLERHGIVAPQVLAVGEQPVGPREVQALLLVRLPAATVPLRQWLASADQEGRASLARAGEELLQRLHRAGLFFRASLDGLEVASTDASPQLTFSSVEQLQLCRRGKLVRGFWDRWRLRSFWTPARRLPRLPLSLPPCTTEGAP